VDVAQLLNTLPLGINIEIIKPSLQSRKPRDLSTRQGNPQYEAALKRARLQCVREN
jgi:hypothetical protein